MNASYAVGRYFARNAALSAGLFLALITGLIATLLLMLMSISESYRSRNFSLETLERVEKLEQASARPRVSTAEAWPSGSPLLEGATVTLASASLLQRITTAVNRVQGNLVSSEMEQQEQGAKDGYLKASATFEIEQPALQKLLYDIEAGMPFLFVDQLVVYAPVSGSGEKMRVLLQVSARWVKTK
jgi:general secretion pathway protein M